MDKDLSIIIPSFQEESSIKETLIYLHDFLDKQKINFEILVVDDNSSDNTKLLVKQLIIEYKRIFFFLNTSKKGFGNSIVKGIECSSGEFISIMMADRSDSAEDLVTYYNFLKLNPNFDCVFGDRWIENSTKNYPLIKGIINRVGNRIISKLFGVTYTDFTNSFKMYKRDLLTEISPIISNHFSITLELPLKSISRGFKYKVIPNSWENREHGVSKLRIINSLITYSIVIVYCLIDKYFWNKRYVSKR